MWDSVTTDSCEACLCPSRSTSFDKENVPQTLSPVKNEELSFYSSSATTAPICTGTSPVHCHHNISIARRPLEDHDPNSHDSGYGYGSDVRFRSYQSPSRGSFESGSSIMDEDYFEDFSDIELLEESNLPQGFGKLISGPIACARTQTSNSPKDLAIRPLFRRALSLQNERGSPNNRARSCLFRANDSRPFKRPEPPLQFESQTITKKAKLEDGIQEDEDMSVPNLPMPLARPIFQRAMSATEESIMSAVQRSSTEPDLIGDFTKTFCLPLTPGRHQDLKSITSATLAQLIQGEFTENVASFKIVDCRYPYEFDGGHIDGAVNIYTKDQCMDLLNNFKVSDEADKRSSILVFHCEFSSERGPNLYRYLRKQDRHLNEESYPSLHFPEIYLLEGGYKRFFEQYSSLCVPISYKEMLHPEHGNDLRHFRQKSKTLNVDIRQRPQYRGNFKRLDL